MSNETYINVRHYTDVESFIVLSDNGNTLTVQKVGRVFKPQMEVGGFSAVCANIKEQREAPIIPTGEPFELIRRKNGDIGMWKDDVLFAYPVNSFKEGVVPELLEKNPNWRLNGDYVFVYSGFRADGTPKKKFHKFPQPEARCHAFYDYNF